jgi:AcrR family transcriptional regulator
MAVPVEDRTRARIIDAAAGLLVRSPRSSLAEVAASAGVGRTTVHRYFPTREALLDALAIAAVERIGAAIGASQIDTGSAREALARLTAALLPLADEYQFASSPESWAALPQLRAAWDGLDAQVAALIDRGKAAGEFRADLATPVIVDAFAGLVWAIGCGIADGRIAPRSAPSDLVLLLTEGIAS